LEVGQDLTYFCPVKVSPVYGSDDILIRNKCGAPGEDQLLKVSTSVLGPSVKVFNFDFSSDMNDYGDITTIKSGDFGEGENSSIFIAVTSLSKQSLYIYRTNETGL
jgi:hypothetical protein